MPRIPSNNTFSSGIFNPLSSERTDLPEQPADPTTSEVLGAAFRVENSAVSAYMEADLSGSIQEGYDVLDDISGYEVFADSFLESQHPDDTARIKLQIDREIEDRQILSTGGATAFLGQIAAGVLDPVYLPLMAIPGSKIVSQGGKSALGLGALSAASEAVAEVAKHDSQISRTELESVINVAGAAILTGVAGMGIDFVKSSKGQALAKQINDDMVEPNYSVGSAEVVKASADDLELVNVGGLEKWNASPMLQMMNSESLTAKQIASELIETPLVTKGNKQGKVTSPVGGTIETKVKRLQDAPMGAAIESGQKLYKAYRQRIKGTGEKKLNANEFWEHVGRAHRRGDVSDIPEVQQMAVWGRKHVFDPAKNRAIEARLLPEDVKISTADGYFMRSYRHNAIIGKRDVWNKTVEDWLARVEPKLSKAEIQGVQREITDNILGNAYGRMEYDAIPLVRGPLKERVFNIPDDLIEEFLEDNAGIVYRDYLRTIVPDTELVDAYGDVAMSSQLDAIRADYQNLIDAASTTKERAKLNRKMDRTINAVEGVRERLRGTYLGGGDPAGWAVRATRLIRDVNFLRMLGGMTLSALPDLARPVAVNGLGQSLKGVAAIAAMPKKLGIAMKTAKKWGIGLDMTLNSRAASLSAVDDVFAGATKIERGSKLLSNQFSKVSLMAPWNAALKQWVGVVNADRVLVEAVKWSKGKISKSSMTRMAQSGIDESMAKRIAAQFAKHGDDDSILKLAQVQNWTDGEAADVFTNVILRDADRTILTPSIGERPLWTDNELGKTIFQFKTFAAAAHHKMLLADLQFRDVNVLNGFLMTVALGGAAYGAKMYAAGRENEIDLDDPGKLLIEALDRSGAFGYMWDMNNAVEKISGGAWGANPALEAIGVIKKGTPMSRYASRNWVGALAGPSFGTLTDMGRVVSDTASGEVDEGTVRAVRKLMPYQNLFYIRRLLNEFEKVAAEGVE